MKTVLVTGGTTRLGKAISDALRSKGWQVFTSSHRADAGADFVADLSEPLGPARLYAAVSARLGGQPPVALVNNAALFDGPAEKLTALNLDAPKKLTTLMACREEGMGSVVNVLDCRVLGPAGDADPAREAYTETKRALLAFTRSAAALFSLTTRVNAIAPGPVMTPVGVHEAAGATPLGRPTPAAVAAAVAFLLEAEFTTGCVLPVDGGQSIVADA
jgi:NAD(P)-dependent dehydrogenase (short-subunit alcohol dehydrogenase family)